MLVVTCASEHKLTEKLGLEDHAATAWTRRGGCIMVGWILAGGICPMGHAARHIAVASGLVRQPQRDDWLPLDCTQFERRTGRKLVC